VRNKIPQEDIVQPCRLQCHQDRRQPLGFPSGTSVVGTRVRDGLRLVDYLETRPEFDTERLGAMGISAGAMHTFF
jgi:dienelactone hydrolase